MHQGIFFLYEFLPQSMKLSTSSVQCARQSCQMAAKIDPCLAFSLIKIMYDLLL